MVSYNIVQCKGYCGDEPAPRPPQCLCIFGESFRRPPSQRSGNTLANMCIYISIYISLYIYIYIYTHIHIYTLLYISLSLYIYIYIYICLSIYLRPAGPARPARPGRSAGQGSRAPELSVYLRSIYLYMYIYIYIYIYVYRSIYVQPSAPAKGFRSSSVV